MRELGRPDARGINMPKKPFFKKWDYFYTASAERSDPVLTESENLYLMTS